MTLFSNVTGVIGAWYSWGVAVAFAITFVTTLWIFYDAQSNGYHAPLWRWLSLLMAMVVIPSVVLSFSPALAATLPVSLLNILALAGMSATVVSLLSLLMYALGLGVDYPLDEVEETPMFAPPPDAGASDTPSQVRTAVTPPHGVTPLTTTKEKLTPQPVTPTGNDTVRIKNAYDNVLPLAWVVVLNGPFAGREFRLHRITDIGREPDHNDVVIDDRTISRQHARIRYEKGAYVIYDLASANGVFVNGEQVQRRVLTHGDRIKLGQVMLGVLMVQEEDEPAAVPDGPVAGAF